MTSNRCNGSPRSVIEAFAFGSERSRSGQQAFTIFVKRETSGRRFCAPQDARFLGQLEEIYVGNGRKFRLAELVPDDYNPSLLRAMRSHTLKCSGLQVLMYSERPAHGSAIPNQLHLFQLDFLRETGAFLEMLHKLPVLLQVI
jgi:hypothetical protein